MVITAITLLALTACGVQTGTDTPPGAPNAAGATGGSVPQPPAAPTVLLKLTSNGAKSTANFTTGAHWNLQYTYNCSNSSASGKFAVSDESGKSLLDESKTQGSGSTPQTTSGTHHLQVSTGCNWTIAVTD